MSAVLLFLIALLLGIVIHRECLSREGWGSGPWLSLWRVGHRTVSEGERSTVRASILHRTSQGLPVMGRECPHAHEQRGSPPPWDVARSLGPMRAVWDPLGPAHVWGRVGAQDMGLGGLPKPLPWTAALSPCWG